MAAALGMVFLLLCPRSSWATGECPAGLFSIAAQVVKVEPYGAPLAKRTTEGRDVPVGVDGLICAGESLQLLPDGSALRVELYASGRRLTLVPPDRFVSRRGVVAFASQGLAFLSDAIRGTDTIKAPPDVPGPTAARGTTTAPASSAVQIHAMRLLENMPRQTVTPDLAVLLSWRDGQEPYVCEAVSDKGDVVWRAPGSTSSSWCEMATGLDKSAQWLVRDARGRSTAWNIRFVSWPDVPRPPWLDPAGSRPSIPDRTAWAWWLWKNAGPVWRLQALAMLHEAAPQEWAAGYLRDQLLAESASYAP